MKLQIRQSTLDDLGNNPEVQTLLVKALSTLLGARRSDENGRLTEIDDRRLSGDFSETLTVQDLVSFFNKQDNARVVATEAEIFVVMRKANFQNETFFVPRAIVGGSPTDENGDLLPAINWETWLNSSGGVRTTRETSNGALVMFSLSWQGKSLDTRDLMTLHETQITRYSKPIFDVNDWSQIGIEGATANMEFFTLGEIKTELEKAIWQIEE